MGSLRYSTNTFYRISPDKSGTTDALKLVPTTISYWQRVPHMRIEHRYCGYKKVYSNIKYKRKSCSKHLQQQSCQGKAERVASKDDETKDAIDPSL
jgi:hypothetical protein